MEDKIFNDIRIEDTIADNEELIIDKIIIKEMYKKLYTLLNTILSDIEKKVIEMIYGIKGKQYKQIEIAVILNIPQYKISRIKKKALKQLKCYINDTVWKNFFKIYIKNGLKML